MANSTMEKFGYPQSLVQDYVHWAVLLRPAQVTLGSLVLAAKSDAEAFSELPPQAFAELSTIVPAIERALKRQCNYERINYLMLMMVDPHVHFHVFPRYSTEREWNGASFADVGWPGPPDLKSARQLSEQELIALRNALAAFFN